MDSVVEASSLCLDLVFIAQHRNYRPLYCVVHLASSFSGQFDWQSSNETRLLTQ